VGFVHILDCLQQKHADIVVLLVAFVSVEPRDGLVEDTFSPRPEQP
jgi:hypothetical protein